MNRRLLLRLLLLVAAPSLADDGVLARMRARQSELVSLRARLEQVKSYPQLGIDDPVERGRLYVERTRNGARVRLEIETPEPRILIVKDGAYLLFQPRIRQALEGRLGKLGGAGKTGLFTGILTGSPEALRELERSYSVEQLPDETLGERAVHHLRFTGREGAAVHCRRIDLFVDVELSLPLRQVCREANESAITFTLSDVELDVPLDRKLFEIDLPAGVERVKG